MRYFFPPTKITNIGKTDIGKCWQGCGAPVQGWWEYKMHAKWCCGRLLGSGKSQTYTEHTTHRFSSWVVMQEK